MDKEKELEVAAAHGVGLPLSKIAELVDEEEASVQLVVEKKVTKKGSGLDEIYLAYRLAMAPKVQRLLKKTLRAIDAQLEGAKLADLVKLYKEIAPATGLIPEAVETTTTGTVQAPRVDVNNPAVIRALRERLVTERILQEPEKQLALPSVPTGT